MNQFYNAWNFYFNNWQYFALLAAPVFVVEIAIAYLLIPIENISPEDLTEFFGDKDNLDLMEEDISTIGNLKDKGYKVLVLLISGRPMNIAQHIDNWDGFAALWLPGTEGDGVSDILFGDFQSTGKLSYPWPIKTEDGANADPNDLLYNIGFGL